MSLLCKILAGLEIRSQLRSTCYLLLSASRPQSTPAQRPTAPIAGLCDTATFSCIRTEKGVTWHSQNHEIFTRLHEVWHWAEDRGPCTMRNVSFQGEGESCKEHGEAVTCLANAKCGMSFNRSKPLILWFFQHRWKYLGVAQLLQILSAQIRKPF